MSAPKRPFDAGWVQANLPNGVDNIMRFVLVWQGKLPSTGNDRKTDKVMEIREQLSPQLAYLWDTHPALEVLKEQGYVRDPDQGYTFVPYATPRQIGEEFPGSMVNLCDWMEVGDRRYKPLVRKSLDLCCKLKILFLKQEDPGAIITQGGDLDGRIKTLLDALRMPSKDEQDRAPPKQSEIFCLMQSDSLVSSLDVETERLLFPESKHSHEAQLVIEVSLRVLRVSQANYCLL